METRLVRGESRGWLVSPEHSRKGDVMALKRWRRYFSEEPGFSREQTANFDLKLDSHGHRDTRTSQDLCCCQVRFTCLFDRKEQRNKVILGKKPNRFYCASRTVTAVLALHRNTEACEVPARDSSPSREGAPFIAFRKAQQT